MKIRKLLVSLIVLPLSLVAAHAAVVPWSATLDPSQEVPAPTLGGATPSGSATGTIDDILNILTWSISWSGLTSPPTGLHFHGPAGPGFTAGVRVNVGNISGLATPSNGSTIITGAHTAELLAGLWYINLHTQTNTAGEIRGQVLRVPEPGTWGLVFAALAGLLATRRRVA